MSDRDSRRYRSYSRSSYRYKSRSRTKSRSRHRYYDRYSRSRSKSYRSNYRSNTRSPYSSRKRHIGDRDNPEPCRVIGVFGLSLATQERDLREIFSKYGRISELQVVHDKKTGRSRGFAFIYFENVEDAIAAKDALTGTDIDGHKIRIDFSITKRPHTPTPGIYLGKPTVTNRRSGYRSGYYYGSGYRRSPSYERYRDYSCSRSRSRSRSYGRRRS